MTYPDDVVEKARAAHALAIAKLFDESNRHTLWGPEITEAKIKDAWRAALAAAEAAMWRPIETAPRDGTHVLVVNRLNPNIPPAPVHWFDGAWSLSANQKAEYSDWVWGQPTHWRPLPTPPAASPGRERP